MLLRYCVSQISWVSSFKLKEGNKVYQSSKVSLINRTNLPTELSRRIAISGATMRLFALSFSVRMPGCCNVKRERQVREGRKEGRKEGRQSLSWLLIHSLLTRPQASVRWTLSVNKQTRITVFWFCSWILRDV